MKWQSEPSSALRGFARIAIYLDWIEEASKVLLVAIALNPTVRNARLAQETG